MVAARLTIILGLVIMASSSSRASQSTPAPAPIGGSSADSQQLPQDHQSGRTPAVDCYEGMCWCTSETADCSGNFGKLTFIPKFSENITFLKFSHNKLEEIPDEDFFSNVTGLLLLDLGFNDLRNLSHNSFRKLDKLRYLCMNANPLDLADALPVFEIPSLQELEFKFGRVGKFPDDFFASHPLPELQTLDLTDTFREETLDMDLFSPLPRLQRLKLSSNHIRLVRCGRNFTSLTYLDLSMNYIDLFPRTCKNQTSLYPNLEELNLNYNRIENLDNNVCLPSLRILKLNSNVVRHFVSDMFSINSFPCLEVVSVEKMKRSIRTIKDSAFANPVLRSLSLANNKLSFEPITISENMFSGCSALVNLSLSGNHFCRITEAKMKILFQPLTSLENLDLSMTYLQNLPTEVLGLMPRLTKLSLWGNNMTEIANGTFSGLRNLTSLDLSDNQLTSVHEAAFGTETQSQLQHLDLSGNPFNCSCSDLWFPHWLKANPELFAHPRFDYVCVNYNYTNITSFVDDECNTTTTTITTTTTTTTTTQTTPSTRSTTALHRNVKPALFAILCVFIAVVVLVVIVSVTYLLYTRPCRGYFWNWTGTRGQYHPILP